MRCTQTQFRGASWRGGCSLRELEGGVAAFGDGTAQAKVQSLQCLPCPWVVRGRGSPNGIARPQGSAVVSSALGGLRGPRGSPWFRCSFWLQGEGCVGGGGEGTLDKGVT